MPFKSPIRLLLKALLYAHAVTHTAMAPNHIKVTVWNFFPSLCGIEVPSRSICKCIQQMIETRMEITYLIFVIFATMSDDTDSVWIKSLSSRNRRKNTNQNGKYILKRNRSIASYAVCEMKILIILLVCVCTVQ